MQSTWTGLCRDNKWKTEESKLTLEQTKKNSSSSMNEFPSCYIAAYECVVWASVRNWVNNHTQYVHKNLSWRSTHSIHVGQFIAVFLSAYIIGTSKMENRRM